MTPKQGGKQAEPFFEKWHHTDTKNVKAIWTRVRVLGVRDAKLSIVAWKMDA